MKSSLFFLCTIALISCGQARQADVPKDPIVTPKLQHFPAETVRTTTNVLFLWKKGITHQEVTQMTTLGEQFAQLKGKIDALQAARAPLPPELMAQVAQTRGRMVELSERFMTPKWVELNLVSSPPSIQLEGWTAPISDLRYREEGGVVTFQSVDPARKEQWMFTLSRNRYELTSKGFVSFYGDIVMLTADGQSRYGVIKLLGKKTQ